MKPRERTTPPTSWYWRGFTRGCLGWPAPRGLTPEQAREEAEGYAAWIATRPRGGQR